MIGGDFDQADWRHCSRKDEHNAHAWTAWFELTKGTVIPSRWLSSVYWCDGRALADYLEDK